MTKIIVFTDGGARGNPGPAAIGVQFLDEAGVVLGELSETIGDATNNVAEYSAVKRALEHLVKTVEDAKTTELAFNLDSQLVERQLNGAYKIKDPHLKVFAEDINALRERFSSVSFHHVRREQNKEADRLVNEALDEK